jgi:hypothetical protein
VVFKQLFADYDAYARQASLGSLRFEIAGKP